MQLWRRASDMTGSGRPPDVIWLRRVKGDVTSGFLYEEDYLHHERVVLFGCSRGDAIVTHLPLADHLCALYAGQDDARTAESLNPIIGLMTRLMAR